MVNVYKKDNKIIICSSKITVAFDQNLPKSKVGEIIALFGLSVGEGERVEKILRTTR